MFKKGEMEKRLKKISKQEAQIFKLLEKQESELMKAVDENETLVETILAEESQDEVKIKMEIEELTGKIGLLNCQLRQVCLTRKKLPGLVYQF